MNSEQFFKLISDGSLEEISRTLAEYPEFVMAVDGKGKTPLHWAVLKSDFIIASLLILKDADVNAQDTNGRTPLHELAFCGHYFQMQMLIEGGANANARDHEGETPLHAAATSGVSEAVKILLPHCAEVDVRDNFGNTPLHAAIGANMMQHEVHLYIRTAEELIKSGASLSVRNNDGQTVLDLARQQPYPELAETLVRYSAK